MSTGLILTIILHMQTGTMDDLTIFDFSQASNLDSWMIVDDGVMGGLSQGNLNMTKDGHAVFHGTVSLENNGGFSSVRFRPSVHDINGYTHFTFRIKGDGKKYQFRAKGNVNDAHSYISYFETTGVWQIISIPVKDMYPTFRGRKLNMENYSGEHLAEIAFLVGNKREESFQLELEYMKMK